MRKRLFFLVLISLCCLNSVCLAQDKQAIADVLRNIEQGRRALAEDFETLSGELKISSGSSESEELEYSSEQHMLFYKDADSLRVEYIEPRRGTEASAEVGKNDVTRILVNTKDWFYEYLPVGATDASLVKRPASRVKDKLPAREHYGVIGALVGTDGYHDANAVDWTQFQEAIDSVEYRPYEGVSEALWLKGVDADKAGNISDFTFVFDPKQRYALLFYEVNVELPERQTKLIVSGTRTTQATADGKILPKEVARYSSTESVADGQKRIQTTGSRAVVTIVSTEKPDAELFSEESFKKLGRNCVVAEVPKRMQPVNYPRPKTARLKHRSPVGGIVLAIFAAVAIQAYRSYVRNKKTS
jgi:hypothetical protein